MKEVLLKPLNERVSVATQTRVLDTLLAKQCNVMMACGGQGICATCHVFVEKGMEGLSPMTNREERTLSLITGAGKHSRLACQCQVMNDGVEIRLPEGMYVQSFNDLEELIGKRTQEPILHPFDGRVLIENGKFITRSAIMQLADVDFNVGGVSTTDR
ncbi:MAG: 2Fe-2S iron-sulfur cluster-binding protein [Synoicihabitans sp.]